jgi:xanthine dehydrogenase YagT iron-sulfur-binding subunit
MVANAPAVDIPASSTPPGATGCIPGTSESESNGRNTNIGAPVPSYPVTATVNGAEYTLRLEAWVTLLDLLRDRLDLTGTKKGCDHGQCGACTVLIDGKRSLSCLTLAVMRNGSEITTVEGLADGDDLHPLQQAFIEQDAFQCGYCTPGQLCSAIGLISEGEAKTAAEMRELMSGNLCRCGAYPQIVSAISEVMRADAGHTERDEITIVGSVPA